MNKIIITIAGLLISNLSLSCADTPPAHLPVLTKFNSHILESAGKNEVAEVKAVLQLTNDGDVEKVEIVYIKPEYLDAEKITKAIKESRFKVSHKMKDYVHLFNFNIIKP